MCEQNARLGHSNDGGMAQSMCVFNVVSFPKLVKFARSLYQRRIATHVCQVLMAVSRCISYQQVPHTGKNDFKKAIK